MKLAFSQVVAASVQDLEHCVAQVEDAELWDAAGVVVKVRAALWRRFISLDADTSNDLELAHDALERRASGLKIFLLPDAHELCSDEGTPYRLELPACIQIVFREAQVSLEPTSGNELELIRQADLEKALRSQFDRCLVRASENHHFALPSGAHASLFIRLAEAFVDLSIVDLIAFWSALRIISDHPGRRRDSFDLVVDHPSMLVLGLRVARFFHRVNVISLPSYSTDVKTRTEIIRSLKALGTGNVVLLIGIASTGRLAKFVSECAQAADCPVPQTFILFGVQDIAEQDVLCRLELKEYQHFPAAPVCQLCRKGSQPVQISGSSYLAGYAPTEAVALPQKWFERQKSFVQRFGRLPGVLKVHFNDPNEYTPRHHAFYVDVGRLLDSQDVRSELRDLLKSLTPQPDFALLPAHPVSERLSVFLKSDLAIGSLMFQGKLSDLEQHPREALAASKSLLILDDVFITGSRLDSINRQLRESADKLCPQLTNIHFVTVLATSPSEERYHRRKTGLTAVHKWTSNLVHLYQVPLPDWHSANQCPWCKEHAILSEIAKAETLLEGPVVERLSQLGDPKRGVETNPYFIPFASSPLPNLGAQSAVLAADSSPMQVLFACASGLQQLRAATVGPRLAADRYPAPTFLAERVFSNNYTERLIWLALLRGALPVELEPALKSFLRTIAEATARNEEERFLKGEMGLLYLLGSLGPLPETGTMRAMFVDLGIAWETLVRLGYVSAEANVPAGIASASVVAQRAAISKTRKGLRHVLGETLRSAFQKVFG